jgi:hypothetical protein
VVAARLAAPAARRGRALWCEPVPLTAAVALLGAVGVQLATAVQIRGGEVLGVTAFDLLANGRYQDVVLAPLVALGLGFLARRERGPVGLEVGVAAVALATAVFVQTRLDDPASIIEPAFVGAWARGAPIDDPVLVPTAVAVVVLALLVLLRSSGRSAWRASAVPLLVLVVLVGVGVDRSERLVDASERAVADGPDVAEVRAVLDGEPVAMAYENRTLWATILIGWELAAEGVEPYPSGEAPPERFVIAPVGADGRPDVDGLAGAERRADIPASSAVRDPLALWELPG